MTLLMTVLGIVVFVIGLLFSIAWHEAGHLAMGKLFGVRVPQYMVGFGRTIWSKKIGETEYGLKAVPAGGYCRLIGMFPPDDDGKLKAKSTSPWRSMIEEAREASYEEVGPGDETRMFYTRKPWQKFLIMFAGPAMNLVLGVAILAGVWMAYGVPKPSNQVGLVVDCVVPATEADRKCTPQDVPAPAAAAGLKVGDRIVSFNGTKITSYGQLQPLIRKSMGPVDVVVQRDGQQVTLHPVLVANKVQKFDSHDQPIKGEYLETGYLGFSPRSVVTPLTAGQVTDEMRFYMDKSVEGLMRIPQKIPALWGAAFQGEERDKDSPVGMVGAARIGGDVLAADAPAAARVMTMLQLLAMINIGLFLFNMLPLLPLDGGHMVGAIWESVRRRIARVFKRPDPGPFDVAKLMPVAYAVAVVFIGFTVLVLIADLVNPVKVT
ncbi:M50 family metallopeptidase [Yinghuangia seranimata]|uniref:M50 family metallopeptidase n=1 Tax=Yinghuangia seranimata TaxID=408067 RepID=UPI00248BAF81|nr:site-2 protease family protein [Yinghuangia seranimata]MDI2132773.1 site-2 protease family protein [Yinghuangia seranimata]